MTTSYAGKPGVDSNYLESPLAVVNVLVNGNCKNNMNTIDDGICFDGNGGDGDSLSESEREKTDSTPENLKKINDSLADMAGYRSPDITKDSIYCQDDGPHIGQSIRSKTKGILLQFNCLFLNFILNLLLLLLLFQGFCLSPKPF